MLRCLEKEQMSSHGGMCPSLGRIHFLILQLFTLLLKVGWTMGQLDKWMKILSGYLSVGFQSIYISLATLVYQWKGSSLGLLAYHPPVMWEVVPPCYLDGQPCWKSVLVFKLWLNSFKPLNKDLFSKPQRVFTGPAVGYLHIYCQIPGSCLCVSAWCSCSYFSMRLLSECWYCWRLHALWSLTSSMTK